MPETVECSECGASYDSDQNPFCPRCGSTTRGAAVPGHVVASARRSPGRRRVQGSGVVLFAIGLLFLTSAAASFLIPADEAAEPLVDLLAGQPGGTVVVDFPPADFTGDGQAVVRLFTIDGTEVANATGAIGAEVRLAMPDASARIEASQLGLTWNRTVLALAGETVRVELAHGPDGNAADPEDRIEVSAGIRSATSAARYVLLGLSALLAAGGMCAILLRAFPLAAVAALIGAVLALLSLFAFFAAGLLFAIPFGLCAYFILRGRPHFRQRAPQSPPPQPPAPPPGP